MATGLMGKIIVIKSETVKYVVVEVPQACNCPYVEYAMTCGVELEEGPVSRSEVRTLGSGEDDHGAPLGARIGVGMLARLTVVRAALRERLAAAWQHGPRRLPGWLRAARNVAGHRCEVVFVGIRPQDYKATQRGKRKRRATHPIRGAAAWAWRLALLAVAIGAATLCVTAYTQRSVLDLRVPGEGEYGSGVEVNPGHVREAVHEGYYQEDLEDAMELDVDGDGFVSKRELWGNMKGAGMTKGELREQYKAYDLDADMKWSIEEALKFITTAMDLVDD